MSCRCGHGGRGTSCTLGWVFGWSERAKSSTACSGVKGLISSENERKEEEKQNPKHIELILDENWTLRNKKGKK
jgi:hypothetical protein